VEPWTHQTAAWEALRAGRNVAITTPTASGKTLGFNIPVLAAALKDPSSRALFLYPTKALAQDQLKTLQEFSGLSSSAGLPAVSAEIYDGDTSTAVRARIKRNPPQVLLTNPDMLHLGFLPHHDGWARFFAKVKHVVVDEAHSYRGVFGSHVGHVLRRLRRVLAVHGASPRWVACSATVGNPEEFLDQLTGLPFEVVSESGAPSSPKTIALWNPPGSPYTDAVTLLTACVEAGCKTIVFTKARKITELISMWVNRARPEWAGRVRSYRAGYLPEERREIEAELFSDRLKAVISTSALEVGIDVGGLDACVLVGYPGTMISTWQRSGRVGRGGAPSLIVLVGMPDALDQYWMRHPRRFFEFRPESLVADVGNEVIARAHLVCAAAESPIDPQKDGAFYGDLLAREVPHLVKEGRLLEAAEGDRLFSPDGKPQRGVSIRDIGEGYTIVDRDTGELIGTIDSHRAFRDGHPGAVYLHQGLQYVVKDLSWETRRIQVADEPVDFYTQVNYEEETEILGEESSRPVGPPGASCTLHFGRVRVTQRFINYETHRTSDGQYVASYPLTLPPLVFETEALWLKMPQRLNAEVSGKGRHFMGGLHAAEHALIAMMPVHILCDRWDLGGLSTPAHPQVPQPVIFVYDGYPGGVGLARKAFAGFEGLLSTTRELVEDCSCEEGCPACIQSPKCGSGNHPLDKPAALHILGHVDGGARAKGPASRGGTRQDVPSAAPARPEPSRAGPPAPVPPERTGPVVFDVETRHLASEVPGGWSNLPGMRIACAVVYDVDRGEYFVYREEHAEALVRHLRAASLVVGFNTRRFDYGVVQGYTSHDLQRLPTLDLLADLAARLKHRLSLSHLARNTLGVDKTADGVQSVQWWREGQEEKVIEYCKADVRITHDLWRFGQEKRHVLFTHKGTGERVKCPVDW
jgi:DEAD/DEAH box helicase domain-containing protein